MRIAPIAARFADSPKRLRAEAERSARLTHAHPLAIDAACVQAAAIAAALRGEEILRGARAAARTSEMNQQLERAEQLLEDDVDPAQAATELGNSPLGHRSVPTAVFAATSRAGFEQAVVFAVRCGGDTDTIGAMAGAIAEARDGAASIPGRWLDALEDGPRGRRYVEDLASSISS